MFKCQLHSMPGFGCCDVVRMRDGSSANHKARLGHSYIYLITHTETGLRYVGFTYSLGPRWMGHRGAANKFPDWPLYKLMNEDGPCAFVMEDIDECPIPIQRERELDYMRALDSWTPGKGLNTAAQEPLYAIKMCFHVHPESEAEYLALYEERNSVVGSFQPLPPEYQHIDDRLNALKDRLAAEGRRFMPQIPSLTTPCITSAFGQGLEL